MIALVSVDIQGIRTIPLFFSTANTLPEEKKMTNWQNLYLYFVKSERIIKIKSLVSKICCIFEPSFNTEQL